MTYLVVLVTAIGVAYYFRAKWLPLVSKHNEPASPPQSTTVPVQAPVGAQGPNVAASAPNIPATTPSGAPNNPILDAYMHSNPQYVDVKPGQNTGPSMEEVTAPDTLQFVDGTPQVGQVAQGVSMYLKGTCQKTINGVPGNVTVQLYVSDRKAGPYKFYVNSQLVQDITAGIAVQKFPASGPTVTLRIEQAADCTMLAAIQPG